MKPKVRFIKSITKAANKNSTIMPWAGGTRRSASVNKQRATEAPQRNNA